MSLLLVECKPEFLGDVHLRTHTQSANAALYSTLIGAHVAIRQLSALQHPFQIFLTNLFNVYRTITQAFQ